LYENESDLYATLENECASLAKNESYLKALMQVTKNDNNEAKESLINEVKQTIKDRKKVIRKLKKFADEIAIANLNFQ
jgi:hypothetical protein